MNNDILNLILVSLLTKLVIKSNEYMIQITGKAHFCKNSDTANKILLFLLCKNCSLSMVSVLFSLFSITIFCCRNFLLRFFFLLLRLPMLLLQISYIQSLPQIYIIFNLSSNHSPRNKKPTGISSDEFKFVTENIRCRVLGSRDLKYYSVQNMPFHPLECNIPCDQSFLPPRILTQAL